MEIKHGLTGKVIFDGEFADLRGADLSGADLSGADLRGADLSDADLSGADLSGADLRNSDLDFSCWPLWCGSVGVKIDERIARQLLYHAFDVSQEFCKPTDEQKEFINQFHRVLDDTLKPL